MNRRSIIWTVLALTLLGGAGYAYLSPPFFGVPDFHYYALADGIARLFNRCGRWCRERAARDTDEMQPELPLFASG
jgi:hypothetical protein